ncbi:hypothetical protein LSAT2_003275 [Lamellibrachia satsuma]|nr:hypothetical protein LSAT2_003275 [Lamellibrachia satsuma]
METTTLFRVTNFELFVKPNTWVMLLGVTAFSFCVGYISYVNVQNKNKKLYVALGDDGSLKTRAKISRWE